MFDNIIHIRIRRNTKIKHVRKYCKSIYLNDFKPIAKSSNYKSRRKNPPGPLYKGELITTPKPPPFKERGRARPGSNFQQHQLTPSLEGRGGAGRRRSISAGNLKTLNCANRPSRTVNGQPVPPPDRSWSTFVGNLKTLCRAHHPSCAVNCQPVPPPGRRE